VPQERDVLRDLFVGASEDIVPIVGLRTSSRPEVREERRHSPHYLAVGAQQPVGLQRFTSSDQAAHYLGRQSKGSHGTSDRRTQAPHLVVGSLDKRLEGSLITGVSLVGEPGKGVHAGHRMLGAPNCSNRAAAIGNFCFASVD
jgi:hypothetical protein